MSNKRSGCLWIILGGALLLSLFFNLVLVGSRATRTTAHLGADQPEPLQEKTVVEGSGSKKIALIPLRGLISSGISGRIGETMVDDIKEQLRQAVNDDDISAIVIAIDSPGGEVTASDIIYNAVARAREQKPVVISMGSMATSGGYYIACGGSWLIANETTFTGSIGVIIQTFRYNELLGRIGVEPLTFKSGAMKDLLSGTREMTEAEKAYVQHLIMESYGKFVGIVARERKLDEAALRAGVADGRVLTGKDALDEKLINAIGEVEDAYAKARELGNTPDAPVVAYEGTFRISRLLRLFGSESKAEAPKVEINLGLLPSLEPGRAYLLPSICIP